MVNRAITGVLNPIVQFKYVSTGSFFSCNTVTPLDDSVPQQSEGNEILTLAITPTNANNYLYIKFVTATTVSTATGIVAIFQDAGADALASAFMNSPTNSCRSTSITYAKIAGTTSSTTFKVRIGPTTSTVGVNGFTGGRLFGGVNSTVLSITEVLA
jgi:hypothetical protein